jgi:AraC-like DNA-binding protein
MGEVQEDLRETHILGDATTELAVRAQSCPALAARNIAHVGIRDAAAPHRIVRTFLGGAYLHACLDGEGRTLLDGDWRSHGVGVVSVAPPHVPHAFECLPDRRWVCAWVRYDPGSPRSRGGVAGPVFARFDATPLAHAINGLSHEAKAGTDAGCALWIDLIEHYVDRLLAPVGAGSRLAPVWDAVHRDPGRAWRLQHLAGLAAISEEQLRRWTHRALGRSPMRQVAHIRMQAAARLLRERGRTVEQVALAVGYENAFAFSHAFRRLTGVAPSSLRQRGVDRSPPP